MICNSEKYNGNNSDIIDGASYFIKKQISKASKAKPVNIFLIKLNLISKITLKIYGLNYITNLATRVKDEIIKIAGSESSAAYFFGVDTIIFTTDINNSRNVLGNKIITLMETFKFSEKQPVHLSATISNFEVTDKNTDTNKILENILDALSTNNSSTNQLVKSLSQFTNKEQQALQEKVKQTNYLTEKIKNQEVTFVYQPVYNIKEKKIEYYECLMRIKDKDFLYSVGPYVSVAEELHMGPYIDSAALKLIEQALKDYPKCKFSFNLTANIIENKTLFNKIKKLFQNQDFAKRVHIEITETSKQNSVESTICFANNLKEINVKIALDDFGAGYTSFYQLKNIPADVIKIDGSFVKDVINCSVSQNFIKAILAITKNTKVMVVAEFVESKEICDFLIKLGVNLMQGYYFGEPVLVPQPCLK
jgi:EAL domain-containing protein (putative c-di-GMP-specific phosphodiesterase class I)